MVPRIRPHRGLPGAMFPGAELTMRWIDIFLPEPGCNAGFDTLCAQATEAAAGLETIQQRDGLDAVSVTDRMAETGRLLFRALQEHDPGALAPGPDRPGVATLDLDHPVHDELVGYHLVGRGKQLELPWMWLHNGLDFMLRGHPVSVGDRSCDPATDPAQRPWMMRYLHSRFLVGPEGQTTLPAILPQLDASCGQAPRILFVPGHGDRAIRSLIFREAEAVMSALRDGLGGRLAARLEVPDGAVTPSELASACFGFQALHYAGPTSEAVQYDASQGEYWMNLMLEEAAQMTDDTLEELAGMEGEVLGVDPITSLLDDVSERYRQRGGVSVPVGREACAGAGDSRDRSAPRGPGRGDWLLADGPVDPARIGHGGVMPPLVYSNSFRALPLLGKRCIKAGASVFIGPALPLFSRPARRFAGGFYTALASGWCAGAAVWNAALELRRDLGAEHPAWLSYGVRGHATVALPYL